MWRESEGCAIIATTFKVREKYDSSRKGNRERKEKDARIEREKIAKRFRRCFRVNDYESKGAENIETF